MMNRLLMILCLFAPSPALAEPAKLSAKNLVIRGQIESVQQSIINEKQTTVVTLLLDRNPKVKVFVFTSQDATAITKAFADAALKRLEAIGKIQKANLKLSDEALKNNDFKKANTLLKETRSYTTEILSLSKQFGVPAVAEGVLEFKDKNWLLAGTNRPIDSESKDRAIGTAVIRGEAIPGEYSAVIRGEPGKIKRAFSKLAIKSGGMLIAIMGKASADAKIEGLMRAGGKIILGKEGTAALDADKLEALKK